MDRNREVRRSSAMAATTNGISSRRHRSNTPINSPEGNGPVEMHEPGRLRDRAEKKELDRMSRSKRRRNEAESSEESVSDDVSEEEEEEGAVRMIPPHSAVTNHHHSHGRNHLQPQQMNRNKGVVGSAGVNNKAFRSVQGWKPADEVIGFSVPRKARSASAKRLQENFVSGAGATPERIQPQASPSAAPLSPSSSNVSIRNKLKSNGCKQKPPTPSSKASSSNQEELENEIAEVLSGLMAQSQAPLVKESDSTVKFDYNRPNKEPKSRVSPPISTSGSIAPQLPQNPSSSTVPFSSFAPKKKKPKQVSESPNSSTAVKSEFDKPPKIENLMANSERKPIAESQNGVSFTSLDTQTKEMKVRARSSVREAQSVKPEGSCGDVAVTKGNSTCSEMDIQKEEKVGVDLMAPPPPKIRSSPERASEIVFAAVAEPKQVVSIPADEKNRNEKFCKSDRDEILVLEPELKKAKTIPESEEALIIKERNNDLRGDLEKPDRDRYNPESVSGNSKSHTHNEKQYQPHAEKSAQPSSLPLPMSLRSWPGGIPPMGFMPPPQGVPSMDGSQFPPTPIQPLFSQPRPKRCETHCYIARNIHYHQQFMKMIPFWPAPAGPAALFGQKQCNLPIMELQGRAISSPQDKGQALGILPGGMGKEKTPQAANITDAQRKQQQQIMLHQSLPPGAAPSNMMHGPAFVFPFNQQQAAAAVAAASIRPGPANSSSTASATSASMNGSAAAAPTPASVGFSYPNMPPNETQYHLAILQNNPYPFPIPAPPYRGTHPQPVPFFNGSFYAPQMLHPSQLQQQQTGQQVSPGQQNASTPSSSSPAQKQQHLQGQQQRQEQGNGNLNTFPASKTRPAQSESGNQDSPSNADDRSARGPMNVYGHNYSMPIHHQNFALVGTSNGNNNNNHNTNTQGENKKQQYSQYPQQQGSKSGGGEESLPQTFAMSFASMNGGNTAPGGIAVAQNHPVFQNLSEADRRNYQVMQAAVVAQAAQQRKNFRPVEEGKNGDQKKKGLAPKPSVTSEQSIAFSRSESTDPSVFNNITDSSARNMNQQRSRNSITSSSQMGNLQNVQFQQQQFQQQQMVQIQKQQQQFDAAMNNKTSPMNNGSFYGDRLATSSPSAASNFPQNLVQSSGNNSPCHSPHWKNSAKNIPQQQQAMSQQSHTRILFGSGPKPQTSPHGQQTQSTNQSSPPTSSLSKGAGGSPRTPSSNSQVNIASTSLSPQQSKNSASVPSLKTPSILGNPHNMTSSNHGTKSQVQQQQMKQMMNQQPQLFYSPPYMQTQPPQSTSNPANATSGCYLQKRFSEKPQGGSPSATPVTGVSSSTAEAKAGAVNVSRNTKGPSQSISHHPQFQVQSPGGFSYVNTVTAGVQVKATVEQKQQTVGKNFFNAKGTARK